MLSSVRVISTAFARSLTASFMSSRSFAEILSIESRLHIPVHVAIALFTAENLSRSLSQIAPSMVKNASALPQSAFSQTAWRTPSCSLAATRNLASSSCSSLFLDFTIPLMSGTVTITVLLSLRIASREASMTAASPRSILAARISSNCAICRSLAKLSLRLKSSSSGSIDSPSARLSVRYSNGVIP